MKNLRGHRARRARRARARARASRLEATSSRVPCVSRRKRLSGPRPPRPVGPRPRCSVSRNSSRRRVTSCTGTSLNGASAYVSPPRAGVPPRTPPGFVRASIRRVQKARFRRLERRPRICVLHDVITRPTPDCLCYKNCRALHAFALKKWTPRPSRRSPRGWFPTRPATTSKTIVPGRCFDAPVRCTGLSTARLFGETRGVQSRIVSTERRAVFVADSASRRARRAQTSRRAATARVTRRERGGRTKA